MQENQQPEQKVIRIQDSKERLAICQSCGYYTSLSRCQLCGCFMLVKTKLPNAKCPAGHW
jgi:hypothetical protein